MPLNDGPQKRTLGPDNTFRENPPAPYVEFGMSSAFSFLRGASEPVDLVVQANALGYDRIGIADRNSLAGVVRMWSEGLTAKVDALIGCRLVTVCGTEMLAYPQDRAAYGRLSTLLSKGKMATPDGEWQAKDVTEITLDMVAAHSEGLHLIALPGADLDTFEAKLPRLARAVPLTHLAAAFLYRGDDRARINRLDALATRHGLTLLATNDVLYHHPSRRPLQDVMTCIREGTTIHSAGSLLEANGERHLKPPAEMVRLFRDWPHAVRATRELADRIAFRLTDLRYEYLTEVVPEGRTPQEHLEHLTWEGARERYPNGVPKHVAHTIYKEFGLIRTKGIAAYFLTIHDIVRWAREEVSPPILCQGRGSAANSAVCFCLGITSVDPDEHEVLFERFLSEERNEPPDIDIDFEHERREEVIQHIYAKYGRARAGLCATVIHYRPRSAIREVGKALGLTEDVTSKLAGTVWGHFESRMGDERVREAGLDLDDPALRRALMLAREMIGMPRHLSQHVGGFILTETPLTETVPIGNAAMPDRSFIEWDKDDVEALGIYKLDVLALGMLTCIAKAFGLIEAHHGIAYDLATIPKEHDEDEAHRPTYDMLCRGESLGVFQVESRAQMAMLPKLRPRVFYDLVIEVAIVRPGPIQGDMVHPYLKRRRILQADPEAVIDYPRPGPEHNQKELEEILGRTLGVPIFQEQAMKIAMVAAEFSGPEANALRKAMATFRAKGKVSDHKARMVERMVARGYDPDFAARCFSQIEGFGEYGFPESHAASFAKLVYVSSWLKWHHPAVFACALLNSQPMGFYAPAQIVRDARENGVEVRGVDVGASDWDCTLETGGMHERLAASPETRSGDADARYPTRTSFGICGPTGSSPHPASNIPGVRGLAPGSGIGANAVRRDDARGVKAARRHEDAPRGIPDGAPVPRDGRSDAGLALRLGLRQIDGFREEAAARIVAARTDRAFADLDDLRRRARLDARDMRLLAEADALGSLGRSRRQGMWDVMGHVAGRAAPAFDAADAPAQGPDLPVALPDMPLPEEVVADYQTTRLSLKRHPMRFFRASLRSQGYTPASGLWDRGHGANVRVAGLVLVRQKPGSAKGVCFVTLEDETGVVNLVIWPDRFEAFRPVIMSARLMAVQGQVQTDGRVLHVVAAQVENRSDALDRLSDVDLPAQTVRGDEPTHPIHNQVAQLPEPRRHPRNVRVIPKSRDFH
ncbi:error-prone DNA polymerase [Jannaschia aquimarina]|uniref:Error-prone DNA polymerase n=1 Tax=Jannaschia aquimarina TaxID=935700 RepID=A0A0D1EJS3_9RHOB|nr:error-prone DNA polymerase [Jannaschia aquimarina]KIT17246.1 Error-prone DNA polymerase [Jannaschia aquimarina]SNT19050.1 error-prone DNA polymerase [Jannaschia aquimarina]